jgi:hypothetical protein
MSIAQLAYTPEIVLQNASFQSSQPQSNGTYSNISQSNDAIAGLGIPNATWVQGVGQSNDPNISNSLFFSCALNNPVTPNVGVMGLLSTGGGQTGNGSSVGILGDLSVNGDIITSINNATSLATNQNGQIIAGPPPGYNGKMDSNILSSGNSGTVNYLGISTNNSLISTDLTNRICHVWLDVVAKSNTNNFPATTSQAPPGTNAILQISIPSPVGAGQLQPPDANITSGIFTAQIFNNSNTSNTTQFSMYWDFTPSVIYLYIFQNSQLTVSNGDDVEIKGYFNYLF